MVYSVTLGGWDSENSHTDLRKVRDMAYCFNCRRKSDTSNLDRIARFNPAVLEAEAFSGRPSAQHVSVQGKLRKHIDGQVPRKRPSGAENKAAAGS